MVLKLVAAAAALAVISGCSTYYSAPLHAESQNVHCIIHTSPDTKIVFTDEDAVRFERATGERPRCDLLYAAHYDPGTSTVNQRATSMQVEIERLQKRVEELEFTDEDKDAQ